MPLRRIQDKSFLLDAIHIIRDSENNQKYKVYAVVAPSISSQFVYARLGQVIMGLKQLGFFSVVEAALGADMVSYREARELAEKGFLTSSCCPSFVSYIEKSFPTLRPFVSHNLSPMPRWRASSRAPTGRQNHLHRPLHGQEAGVPARGGTPVDRLRAYL